MKQVDRILAEKLLKISAIKLQPENPFTWSSGWNSPIYTDNRKTLSYPEVRNFIKVELSRLVMENFRTLCHTGGVAMVMVTHDAKMADYCDTVYTLEEGLLVCQRRDIPKISVQPGADLLKGPDIRLHTAMVATNFLHEGGESPRTLAHILHEKGLLTHVVTLQGGSLLGKEMQSYSLPMPVRHMGGLQAGSVLKSFLVQPSLAGVESDFTPMKGLLKGFAAARWAKAQGADLAAWAQEEGIDFLYSAGGIHAPVVCWLASRMGGLPFAMDVRDTDIWAGAIQDGRLAELAALRVLVRDAAFVRCSTRELCEAVRTALPETADKVSWIPDPLTLAPQEEEMAVAQMHEAVKLPHILACGCMEDRKGFSVLLKALARLQQEGREFRCTLAGDGPRLKALKSEAKSLGLGKSVRFAGFVPHANMNSLYLDADVYVTCGLSLPGQPSDGIPSALGEAMAFLVPVVASDLPSQAWLVGDAGKIVPRGDDAALAAALAPMLQLEDRESCNRRLAMGTKGRERVLKLLEQVPNALEGLFAPLLQQRGA